MKRHTLPRRALALLLLLAMLVLPACSKYRVEMSNSKQTQVMLTVGETEVAYEVLYFFYHIYLDAHPDDTFPERMARVEASVCELYAIFEVCRAYGIDPYGQAVNETVDATVKEMIDEFPTRRDYIDSITAQHMTDTVSRLLLRSYICESLLLEEMEDELGDDDTLTSFLAREDVVRVLSMTLNFGTQVEAMHLRAEEIMALLAEAEDTDEAFLDIARRKATSENAHTYITTEQWYSLCGEGASAPTLGTVSLPLYEGQTCLIMRVSEKDIAYAKENRDQISISYLECAIREEAERLATRITHTDAYEALSPEGMA